MELCGNVHMCLPGALGLTDYLTQETGPLISLLRHDQVSRCTLGYFQKSSSNFSTMIYLGLTANCTKCPPFLLLFCGSGDNFE